MADLVWTHDKPTEVGFYWYRVIGIVLRVLVHVFMVNGKLSFGRMGSDERIRVEAAPRLAQWSGPARVSSPMVETSPTGIS